MTASLLMTRLAADRIARAGLDLASRDSGGPGSGGPLIGRRAAQELARHELSKLMYQPSITQRILTWLSNLLNSAGAAVPGGWWAVVTLAVLAVLVTAGLFSRLRPTRDRRSPRDAVLAGKPLSAADHRRTAERLAAAGDYSGAIIECVRAIAADLEERTIIPVRPDRTADELAAEAGRELPSHAGDLRAAMRLFDDVRYGDRDGTQAGYQRVSLTDGALRSARAADSAVPQPAITGSGVPR